VYRDFVAHATQRREQGATAVEYALIATGIALVIFAAVALIGPPLASIFQGMASSL
jgi:pilus assembly protein Flp/PilA